MSGEDLAVLVTAVAVSSAQYLSVKDLELLGTVFTQLADTYFTILLRRSLKSENTEKAE
ncbi:MAG: hypothetical protein IK057_05195 [Clostridia bacterium]|nr:hypothetical protein [Clostridia bacterium]